MRPRQPDADLSGSNARRFAHGADDERPWGHGSEKPALVTVMDLRRLLSMLGADDVYGLLASGAIPGRKVGGRWVTTQAAVDAWLDGIANPGDERTAPSPPRLSVHGDAVTGEERAPC